MLKKIVSFFRGHSLSNPEWEKFSVWAFGFCDPIKWHSIFRLKSNKKHMGAWNARHGKKLTLNSDSIISKTLPKMIELWKNEQLPK